jgi:6-phosphogluconolactonase
MPTRVIDREHLQVRVYENGDELAVKAARYFARIADQYVVGCGRFTVVLSGGSTPKSMLSLLATSPFLETVPWASTYFFWGDERCVPPDHADSNYRMAYETLLAKVPVPGENIFRIPAEKDDPEQAAQEYAEMVQTFFLNRSEPNRTIAPVPNLPRFDLIFLGMGADGHTASLFPHTAALDNDRDLVAANYVDRFPAHRITLTKSAINNARNVTFLVAGADKAEALKQVIDGEPQPHRYPSQLIRPRRGTLLWMVDEAAARLI